MTRYPILPHPFTPPKSFFDVGIGTEKLELKPEWSELKERENERDRRDQAEKL